MSAMLAAHVGVANDIPTATLPPVGVVAVAATSELMSSFAAVTLSYAKPDCTIPNSVCIRDMAASSMRNAPAAPCYATV